MKSPGRHAFDSEERQSTFHTNEAGDGVIAVLEASSVLLANVKQTYSNVTSSGKFMENGEALPTNEKYLKSLRMPPFTKIDEPKLTRSGK